MEICIVIFRVILFVASAAVTLYALWQNSIASEAHAELALAKHNFLINDSKCLIYIKQVEALLERRTMEFYALAVCVLTLVPF